MKKFLSLLLLVVLSAFFLTSCFQDKKEPIERDPRVPYSQGPTGPPTIGQPSTPMPE